MITLILNPDGDKREITFDQQEIIVGNQNSTSAHFKIEDPAIKAVHIRIVVESDRIVLINAANDPFTSLNGIPFGKKALKNHDLIQIRNHTIEFIKQEVLKDGSETAPGLSSPECAIIIEKEKEQEECIESNQTTPSIVIDAAPQKEPVPEPELEPQPQPQIALFTSPPEQIEQIIEVKNENSLAEQTDTKANTRLKKTLRKPTWNEKGEESDTKAKPLSFYENWRNLAKIGAIIISLSAIVCTLIYLRASGINSQEEKKIAAGISDIAMAIVHAQRGHILPSKQNWVDPDFIRSNLACVLSPNLHSQAEIDAQGQFTNYSYILRAYTSQDMDRFLVIAQPAPNLLQWLVHKKSIVIDSSTMEMRKISDLKSLNRLLTNPAPFQGQNGIEITKIIKEGSLISLSGLSGNQNNWGFAPPKSLGVIRPGSDNYIYNAPRYYPFGESILRNAIALYQNTITTSEISALQEEIVQLSKFPELILYTSQGLHTAMEAQKALATIAPSSKFLVGYVKFNPMGYVASSHLFMHDDSHTIAMSEPQHFENPQEFNPIDDAEIKNHEQAQESPKMPREQIDINHPLYLRLHAIASSRSRKLTPLGSEITQLIQKQNKDIIPDFYENIANLMEEYKENDKIYRTHMVQELAELYQEYSEMPLQNFMRFIEASHLTSFINEALSHQKNEFRDPSIADKSIESELSLIEEAQTLAEVDERVQEAAELLNLEQFPDPQNLIHFQQKLKSIVLDRLTHMLLSPKSVYTQTKIRDHDRTTMVRILKSAWITDPDEFEYFLNEFDMLQQR